MKQAPELAALVEALRASHQSSATLRCATERLPSPTRIVSLVEQLLELLFPGFHQPTGIAEGGPADDLARRLSTLRTSLRDEIEKGLCVGPSAEPCSTTRSERAQQAADHLLGEIPAIRVLLQTDVEAAYDGDPAAQSLEEIVLAYPGLRAIAVYRLAHVLYLDEVPVVPRVMTEYAHSRTGIDIHPGARIGRRFFIDHGTGVVIGETATIGDNVKIYQGVTLGARSFLRDDRGRVIKGSKRHPDIADDVTIYSGATILGSVRIGARSIIGGNVWLTHSVPEDTKIVIRPPQQIHIDREINDYQI